MGVMEARNRDFSSPAAEESVIVFEVLLEDMVEVVVVVLAAAFRPRGDFLVGGVFSTLAAAFLGELLGATAAGGFSSFRLADFGRPLGLGLVAVSGDALSSTIGEGLFLRPGDLRVPRRVATSWLDARVVRLLSILCVCDANMEQWLVGFRNRDKNFLLLLLLLAAWKKDRVGVPRWLFLN